MIIRSNLLNGKKYSGAKINMVRAGNKRIVPSIKRIPNPTATNAIDKLVKKSNAKKKEKQLAKFASLLFYIFYLLFQSFLRAVYSSLNTSMFLIL